MHAHIWKLEVALQRKWVLCCPSDTIMHYIYDDDDDDDDEDWPLYIPVELSDIC